MAHIQAATTKGQDNFAKGWNIKNTIIPGSMYSTFEQESINNLALNLKGRTE